LLVADDRCSSGPSSGFKSISDPKLAQ